MSRFRGPGAIIGAALSLGCNSLVGFSSLEKVDCIDCGEGGSGGVSAGGSGATGGGGQGGGGGVIVLDDALALGVIVGRHGSCAILEADGSLLCWGQTTGNPERPSSTKPVPVEGITGVASVGFGLHHRCAFTPDDGKVHCWGNNDHGQLGDGTFVSSVTPVEVQGLPPVERISSAGNQNCALTPDDPAVIYCWGDNAYGQLGTGDRIDQPTPQIITGVVTPIRIACGVDYTLAVSDDGTLYAWGRNEDGQLGLDPATSTVELAPQLVAGIPPLERAYPADRHSCGRSQGVRDLLCWGNNDWGQLGDGTTTSRHTAAVVAGVNEVVVGYPGQRHTCAVQADLQAKCFGANDHGQLGQAASDTPVTVPLLVTADSALLASKTAEHTCFAETNGPVQCMGLNASGQLGDGTYESRAAPTTVTY